MPIAFAHARIQIFTFSSAYFTEGPICLGPVSFFLTENYSTCSKSPCERPAHDAQKSALKVVVILVVRLFGIRAG